MRYENPLYMAEDAGAADLIAGGRLQLGISRGSPEQVIDGWRYFGYQPAEGETDADMAREHAEVLPRGAQGRGLRPAEPAADVPQPARPAPRRAALRRAARAHLVGRRLPGDRRLGGRAGHEPAELHPDHQRVGQALPRPAGRADPGLPRRLEGSGPRAGAAGVGQPVASSRSPTSKTGCTSAAAAPGRGPRRLHRREHPGHLRPQLRRRAGQAHRAAQARTRPSPPPTPCC